jgi:uncharacterized membrane protein SpoIIM required for sporulation
MFELLLNPKMGERRPWSLFLVGFFYVVLAIFFVNWIFMNNPVFKEHLSILIIMFTVILSIPFVYYIFKLEEEKDIFEIERGKKLLLIRTHRKALAALLWLFLGFMMAFAVMYIVLPKSIVIQDFEAQINQYCAINSNNMKDCASRYGVTSAVTGSLTEKQGHLINIFVNNIYVMIFCLIFSLAFGAGAIFILAWNASVIATAMGIFSKSDLSELPRAFGRYMLHGIPEILAYLTIALAGGMVGIAIIRHEWKDEKFWLIIQDSIDLILLSIIILAIAALIEVFVTPTLF